MTLARITILLAEDSLIVGKRAQALLGMANDIEPPPAFGSQITATLAATEAA